MRSTRNLLLPVCSVVIGILIALAAIELVVRMLLDDGMQFDLEMKKYALLLKVVSDNPRIGHTHRPNGKAHVMGVDVTTNSAGFRDREFAVDRPPGGLRIMMLGDSLTEGWGVPQDATVSKVLERLFRDAGDPAEVINTGVGNLNTTMEVEAFLQDWARFSPNVVVLNYFINDAEHNPPHDTVNLLSKYSSAWTYITSRIDVAIRMAGRGNQRGWKEYYRGLYDAKINPGGWDNVKAAIRKLQEYCANNGIRLFIVNYPELRELDPYPFEREEAMLRDHSAQLGISYLNLLNGVKKEAPESLWVTRPDPHPNAKADALFARSLFDWLRPQLHDMRSPR